MNFFSEHLKKNFLVAAPMAGVSCAPFRLLLRDYFDGLVYTEMVSVEGTSRANPSSMEYLDIMGDGRPVVAQLFGGNDAAYPAAVDTAEKYSSPDAYDINMGCPVKKVVKTGGGSALLMDLPRVQAIISSLRKGTDKPFSVKIRTGWDDAHPVYREIYNIAESEGADAIILHARTRSQMFGGRINYDALAEIASIAKIPVIGNGDVTSPETLSLMKQTGVDGIMIGRGMMHAPWIFKALPEGKDPSGYLSPPELYKLILRLYGLMKTHAGEDQNKLAHYLNIIKKYSVWFSKGLPEAAVFRGMVYKNTDEKYFLEILNNFYDQKA